MSVDVAIVGAGPSGLAAAAACAARGLSVRVFEPSARPWPNVYGGWREHLDDLPIAKCWDRPLLGTDQAGLKPLEGEYVLIDNVALQTRLRDALPEGALRDAAVASISTGPDGAELVLSSGASASARLVIDATGSGSRFLTRAAAAAAPAMQIAYGQLIEVDQHPWGPGEMSLMDFRTVPDHPGPVTFLYAMPHSPQRVFVEETSLAARPGVPLALLRERLQLRLQRMGVVPRAILSEERCAIPMDLPLPQIPQPIVGFGAAAGFVHPATGYTLQRSFSVAPALAEAIEAGLDEGGPEAAARQAWAVVQPPLLQRTRRLSLLGLRLMLSLERDELPRFMHTFFQAPFVSRSTFLSGTATPTAMLWAMLAMGQRMSLDQAWRVLQHSTGAGRVDLLAGVGLWT